MKPNLPALALDTACLAAIAVVYRGIREEVASISSKGLLENDFFFLAARDLASGFWREVPERVAVAAAALLVLGSLGWLLSRILRRGLALPRSVSRAIRVTAATVVLFAVVLQALLSVAEARRSDSRLNVIVVVIDTLRQDHLGVYGHDARTSPRLDELANSSFVFERAFSTSSWTRPAVASLLTSQTPDQHGIYREDPRDRLAKDSPTLQRMMANQAYGVGATLTQPHYRSGLDEDFDHFWMEGNARASKVYDQAIQFLDLFGERPFFLLVHNLDPHDFYEHREGFSTRPASSTLRTTAPLMPAQKTGGQIPYGSPENVVIALPPEQLEEMKDNYDGEIRYTDHQLGRFLDALAARGLSDRTIIIVTADHGEEFLDHGGYWHGGTLYDELIRIPLIIHVPGMSGGRIVDGVSIIDVLPTIADLTGTPLPRSASGRSLVPLLEGERLEPRPILSATGFRQPRIQQSVILEDLKLIRFADGEFIGLFDLANDPLERVNLGAENPKRAALETLLPRPDAADRTAAGATANETGNPIELDESTKAALRALGYAVDEDQPGPN